jgi:hypothetical protein
VLRAETVKFMRLDEPREPSLSRILFAGDLASQLQREARLVAPARADQRAHRCRRFAFEPTPEIADRALGAEERREVAAISAQQRRF